MSRIGRAPIPLPKGVDVQVAEGHVSVKGPKGHLDVVVSPRISVSVKGGEVHVARPSDHRNDRAQHGLVRSLIANAVTGVSEGFTKHLEIQGVGFRCAMKGSNLELALGFSWNF